MSLYITRHGQTPWNAQGKLCGRTDIGLTQYGEEQARKVAEEVAGHPIDRVIASPLKRAYRTAEIICRRCGLPLSTDDRLMEWDFGECSGEDVQSAQVVFLKSNLAYRFPGGESAIDVAHRAYGLLDEIRALYPDENVLLVSHGGVCRAINTYFSNVRNDDFIDTLIGNCELKKYEFGER